MSPNSIIPVAHRSFLLGWHIIIRFNWSQSKLSNFKIIILNAPLILPMAPVRFNVLKEIWHRYITYNSVDEEVREIDKGDQLCGKFPYRWKLNFWWWACCIVGYLSLLLSHFSRVRLSVTPWTMARQAPLSMGFSRQEYWSGLPFPSLAIKYEVSKVKSLSRVRLFAIPWTVAYQAPLSTGFSRQECWSGLPLPFPIVGYTEVEI